MHNAAFEHFGIDAHYELLPLRPDDLDGFFEQARGDRWLGFQVTAPYKQEAARRCDHVEGIARDIGAVNSVIRTGEGVLRGFNTDAPGFARAVSAGLGREIAGTSVVVAGAGGAARAVVASCLKGRASQVVVGARSLGSSSALAEELADQRVVPTGLGADFEAALAGADLAVNATTVGMTVPGTVFDAGRLPAGAAVFDLVYVPPETELVTTATSRGLDAVNGLGMLVAQAEIAFERWTGIETAGPVMRTALEAMGPDTDA